MNRRFLPWLIAALAPLAAPAALAQFYDLDGVYRCLTVPDSACEDRLRDQPAPPPPPPPPAPTLDQLIAKVRDKSAGPREIELLETRAAASEPRAVEVLAWCKLNGIGGAADPEAAYWLYRQAAQLGVANALKNQIAVYKTRLTPEQRQHVLMRENAN
jgi:TPR repeat protein